jgi:PKD repeat protein
MVKARILAAVVLAVMLLGAFVPGSGAVASVASPPTTPVNFSPDNGTEEIGLAHAFIATVSGSESLINGQWQIVQSDTAPSLEADGSYGQPLWDSGLSDVATVTPPAGVLDYDQKYWWHLRVQDDTGAWSDWSTQTWFSIMANLPPNQPGNESPADKAVDVAVAPILTASKFSDPDPTDDDQLKESLASSEWEVTATAGSYASPAFKATVTGEATSVVVPAAKLSPGVKYYWHVRYQDNHQNWSAWSIQTSFTTKELSTPVAAFSADRTSVIGGEDLVTLTDNSTPAGEIDRWTWDFGDGSSENWTLLTRPSDGRVSHRYSAAADDSSTNIKTLKLTVYNSAAATGVSKTMKITVHTKPAAGFSVAPASAKAGEEISVTDTSTPRDDITSWEWQFDDGTAVTWASPAEREAAGGEIKHTFDKATTHTVSLTVKGPLGESFYSKEIQVTGGGGFHFGLWMIAMAVAVVAVLAGAVYLVRGRKAK